MRDEAVSAGGDSAAAGCSKGAEEGAGWGAASFESEGLAAADAFHDEGLAIGLEADRAGASGAGAASGAAAAALAAAATGARARSGAGAERRALAPAAADEDESEDTCAAGGAAVILEESTLDPSRTGIERDFSVAIASRRSFSV